jgi:hypothetical protein
MKKLALIIVFSCLITLALQAQVFTEISTYAPVITGSGAANLATTADFWSIWANPAGLSRLSAISSGLSFCKPYSQSFSQYYLAGVAVPLNARWGTLALSYYGSEVNYAGSQLTSERALQFSQALFLQRDIISSLAVGYSLNVYFIDYGKSAGVSGDGSDGIELGNAIEWGLNLGLQASLHERIWVGLMVRNLNNPSLGSALSAMPLPKSLAVGVGYEPYDGLKTNLVLSQAIGDYPLQIRGGLEYTIYSWLKLRAGAISNPNQLAMGFGLQRWPLQFDYAFLSHPALPETHQFSLGFQLNPRAK